MNLTNLNWYEHLEYRGLSNKFQQYWLNEENEVITFPIWSPAGFLIGYQRYNWKLNKTRDNSGKYFTWISEPYKQCAFWGMEYTQQDGPLFIVESIWNAARLINHDRAVIATLGSTPHRQVQWLIKSLFPEKERIAICDNDDNLAGDSLKKLGHRWIKPNSGDLNDLTHEEVGDLLCKLDNINLA